MSASSRPKTGTPHSARLEGLRNAIGATDAFMDQELTAVERRQIVRLNATNSEEACRPAHRRARGRARRPQDRPRRTACSRTARRSRDAPSARKGAPTRCYTFDPREVRCTPALEIFRCAHGGRRLRRRRSRGDLGASRSPRHDDVTRRGRACCQAGGQGCAGAAAGAKGNRRDRCVERCRAEVEALEALDRETRDGDRRVRPAGGVAASIARRHT
jgi:hypothetical protein